MSRGRHQEGKWGGVIRQGRGRLQRAAAQVLHVLGALEQRLLLSRLPVEHTCGMLTHGETSGAR